VLGQRVAMLTDEPLAAGTYQTTWDGTDLQSQPVASGVYSYRIKAGEWIETRSMASTRLSLFRS
jgi:hypothetical protein